MLADIVKNISLNHHLVNIQDQLGVCETAMKNIVMKLVYPRTKNWKTCDIYQPVLSPCGGF